MQKNYEENPADFHGSACKYQQNWLQIIIWIDFQIKDH
jgi:hypothetical protein